MGANEKWPVWENDEVIHSIEWDLKNADKIKYIVEAWFQEDSEWNLEYTVQSGWGSWKETLYSISMELYERNITNSSSYTNKKSLTEAKKNFSDLVRIVDEKIQKYADEELGWIRTWIDPNRINIWDKLRIWNAPDYTLQIMKAPSLANNQTWDKEYRNIYEKPKKD